ERLLLGGGGRFDRGKTVANLREEIHAAVRSVGEPLRMVYRASPKRAMSRSNIKARCFLARSSCPKPARLITSFPHTSLTVCRNWRRSSLRRNRPRERLENQG